MRYLIDVVNNPKGLVENFKLGIEYFSNNHLSPAFTHFMKVVDNCTDSDYDIQYCSLCYMSLIYDLMGRRDKSSERMARYAIATKPDCPEGYLLLARSLYKTFSKLDMIQDRWIELYEVTKIGLLFRGHNRLELEWYSDEELLTLYAVSLYKMSKLKELKEFLNEFGHEIQSNQLKSVIYDIYNSLRWNNPYTKKHGYSQSFQDRFVSDLTKGKSNLTYLEIGSGDWDWNNNTLLLEKSGWTGISIDIDPKSVKEFNLNRCNQCIEGNALNIDWIELLSKKFRGKDWIDYLQVDIDPAYQSYSVLLKLLHTEFKFGIVTFEHDAYISDNIRSLSRKVMSDNGYKLLVPDVTHNLTQSYEDWYIHEDYQLGEGADDFIKSLEDKNYNIHELYKR